MSKAIVQAHTIVTLSMLSTCPQMRMDPQHWIPEHKIEECHPDLIQKAKDRLIELRKKKSEFIDEQTQEYQDYLASLRHSQGA